jgi:hypothetical protein
VGQRSAWETAFLFPVFSEFQYRIGQPSYWEAELNASLWGNDFEMIAKFQIHEKVKYQIGPIAHSDYRGVDGGQPFYQRSFVTPRGIFKQVSFLADRRTFEKDWTKYVRDLGKDFVIKAHRYAREASRRAKAWKQ